MLGPWPGRARGLVLCVALGLVAGTLGPAAAVAGEVAFRAKVKDLGLQTGHLDRGKTLDDVIEVVLPGAFSETPRELGMIQRTAADYGTPESAARADFSAWKADDADWIQSNFARADRDAIGQFLANPELREATRKGFGRYESIYLWGVVSHGDYALALVTYGQGAQRERGLVATFLKEHGAWKRTNALSADETMDVVWSGFRGGEVEARQ